MFLAKKLRGENLLWFLPAFTSRRQPTPVSRAEGVKFLLLHTFLIVAILRRRVDLSSG